MSLDVAAGSSQWALANVRVNRKGGKGSQQLSKKQREQRFDIPLRSLRRCNLYLDL